MLDLGLKEMHLETSRLESKATGLVSVSRSLLYSHTSDNADMGLKYDSDSRIVKKKKRNIFEAESHQ